MSLQSNPQPGDGTMTPIREPHATQPFANDADYLEAEFAWVAARCRHLGARIDAENEARDQQVGLIDADDPQAGWSGETKEKVARLAIAETTLRETIDARLEATKAAGRALGLDRIARRHDLGGG